MGVAFLTSLATAEPPNPVLKTVFPAGGRAGSIAELSLTGEHLGTAQSLRCSHPSITGERSEGDLWRVSIPGDIGPGSFDLQVVTQDGLSSIRTFVVGNRREQLEGESNDELSAAEPVPLDVVINGRIEEGGDLDHFRFTAGQGQRVIIECRAERIDSPLRAVLEVFDADGNRVAVNRGFFGIDPLIDFHVPLDGEYVVRVFDLVYSGSADHIYRLEIDTGPRVLFAFPDLLQRGKTTPVTLYGWNLQQTGETPGVEATSVSNVSSLPAHTRVPLDAVEVEVTPPPGDQSHLPLRQSSTELGVEQFAYYLPGLHAPIPIGITDAPVLSDGNENHDPASAVLLSVPAEVCGQLTAPAEMDWYSLEARRGEVLWIEAVGDRIGSPVDLDVSLFDEEAQNELAHFGDDVRDAGGSRFPSSHADPIGRWVVPYDGRYRIMIRNLTSGPQVDPRRLYRLSVRREEPDFALAVVPRSDAPAGLNVPRGGRLCVDLIARRGRGLDDSIRVTARNLPEGIMCPEVWLGPGVNRAPLVLSADDAAQTAAGELQLVAVAHSTGAKPVRGSTVVRVGRPNGWSRLTDQITLAAGSESAIRLTADGHETRPHHLYGDLQVRHSPGSILDVSVTVDRRIEDHAAPVRLIGVGVPDLIDNQTAIIPEGQSKGVISFYLPPTLPVGTYTIAVQGETTVAVGDADENGQQPTESVTVVTNPVTFEVEPAGFVVDVDAFAPQKIARGEIVQVGYSARRINGFIGKIHTELYAAGPVLGLRGRGVTFVGQTETGSIQIVANEDAPLGRQPFLRLYGVGVVEDQPFFHGSCFLNLEVVESIDRNE